MAGPFAYEVTGFVPPSQAHIHGSSAELECARSRVQRRKTCADGDFRPTTTFRQPPTRPACFRNRFPSAAVRAHPLYLTDSDRRVLSAWIRAGTTPQRVVRRARIVVLFAEGRSARDVATELGVSTRSVALWRQRFESGGPPALLRDAPGRGRKATVTVHARTQVRALLALPPPAGRWTVRALAAAAGISTASAHRVLKAERLTLRSDTGGPDVRTR